MSNTDLSFFYCALHNYFVNLKIYMLIEHDMIYPVIFLLKWFQHFLGDKSAAETREHLGRGILLHCKEKEASLVISWGQNY
jgi:hypothetical protein